jgi:serine/threonine protein kinase
MGAVYAAIDTRLERRVALKVVLQAVLAHRIARARFFQEARAVAAIASDHVVRIFDFGEENGFPFIALEFLRGATLDQYLAAKGLPPLAHVVRIAQEVASGLAAAHSVGVVHRDVKLSNIWLEAPNGRVKLIDFGIARVADEPVGLGPAHAVRVGLTVVGAVLGTPAYMSPEQVRGLPIDGRTDLWSLGVVLYRLCTGRMPFTGADEHAVMANVLTDTPVPTRQLNPRVPEVVEVIISRLLAKEPGERYQTAAEVADALKAVLTDMLTQTAAGAVPNDRPPQPDAPTRPALRRPGGAPGSEPRDDPR